MGGHAARAVEMKEKFEDFRRKADEATRDKEHLTKLIDKVKTLQTQTTNIDGRMTRGINALRKVHDLFITQSKSLGVVASTDSQADELTIRQVLLPSEIDDATKEFELVSLSPLSFAHY